MVKLLGISKAARIAGVPREEIQRHIADGTLTAFEGKVEVGQLHTLFPEIEQREGDMLEALSQIKEDALAKSLKETSGIQDVDSLASEVKQLRREAAHYKQQVNEYRQLTVDLRQMLTDLKAKVEQKQRVAAVIRWLEKKRKTLP